MSEEKLVPKLRFTGFLEEWNQHYLEDVIESFVNGQTPSRNVDLYWNGEIPWVSSGELNYNHITSTFEQITEEGQKNANLKIIPSGTFLMAITGLEAAGTRGSCAILDIDATTNQSCMALFPKKDKLTTKFLYYWYLKVGEHYGIKYTQGTKQQSYNKELLQKLPIVLPVNLKEQEKITDFLSSLNYKIELLENKYQKYIDFKKYLMQQIFAQKLRFAGFNKEYDEYVISDLFSSKKGSGLSKDAIDENGTNKCVLYGELYTTYSEIIDKIQSRTNSECNCLSKSGDILIPASTTTKGIDLVTASVILEDNVYLGGDITILRNKNDSIVNNSYFAYYFTNGLIKEVSRLTQGSTIIHLYWKDFKKVKVKLPDIKEQEKITSLFVDIDKKLKDIDNSIESMLMFKKGLLQQMFV